MPGVRKAVCSRDEPGGYNLCVLCWWHNTRWTLSDSVAKTKWEVLWVTRIMAVVKKNPWKSPSQVNAGWWVLSGPSYFRSSVRIWYWISWEDAPPTLCLAPREHPASRAFWWQTASGHSPFPPPTTRSLHGRPKTRQVCSTEQSVRVWSHVELLLTTTDLWNAD